MHQHRSGGTSHGRRAFLRGGAALHVARAALLALLLAGCAVQPTTGSRLTPHSVLAQDRSVLLVVDMCVNFSPLAGSDYFVVAPAQQSAETMTDAVQQFLALHGVKVGAALAPFICGALHDKGNAPKKVAAAIDGELSERPQPLWVATPVASDAPYRDALLDLATYAYQGALVRTEAAPAEAAAQRFVNDDRAQQAMQVIRARSGHATLLYVGVTGSSMSTEKASAFNVLRVVGGLALSMAIGPIAISGGYGIQPVFVAGPVRDSTQMAAALIDLGELRIARTRVIHTNGDPLKADALVNPEGLGLLLREITLTPQERRTP